MHFVMIVTIGQPDCFVYLFPLSRVKSTLVLAGLSVANQLENELEERGLILAESCSDLQLQ
jgi:hypothetical protein